MRRDVRASCTALSFSFPPASQPLVQIRDGAPLLNDDPIVFVELNDNAPIIPFAPTGTCVLQTFVESFEGEEVGRPSVFVAGCCASLTCACFCACVCFVCFVCALCVCLLCVCV